MGDGLGNLIGGALAGVTFLGLSLVGLRLGLEGYHAASTYLTRNDASISFAERENLSCTIQTELGGKFMKTGKHLCITYRVNDEDKVDSLALYQDGKKVDVGWVQNGGEARASGWYTPDLDKLAPGKYEFEVRGRDYKDNDTASAKATLEVVDKPKLRELSDRI